MMTAANRSEDTWRDSLDRIRRRPLYVAVSLLLVLTAAIGFIPRMVRAFVAGQVPSDWIIHVHVAVYWLWLGLFSAQTINAATTLNSVYAGSRPKVQASAEKSPFHVVRPHCLAFGCHGFGTLSPDIPFCR